jgi:hypothetical protein
MPRDSDDAEIGIGIDGECTVPLRSHSTRDTSIGQIIVDIVSIGGHQF